jgi:hypothetical protein
MRYALTMAVFAANVWAIVAVLGSGARPAARLAWVLGITLIPIAGAAAWLMPGARARRTMAAVP